MRLSKWQVSGLLAGIIVFFTILLLDTPLHHYGKWGSRPAWAAAVAALMAVWWLTEAIPIYVTACVPLVLYPFSGVFGNGIGTNVAGTVLPYINPYIFLFAGGMCIGAAMQQWDLHRRIALGIMRAIGTDPRHLLFGFLAATAFISLWISNTATAAMMMPIGMAMIAQLERQNRGIRLAGYGMAIMLSIAYGANVGGIGTKIGTAPNAQFSGFMHDLGIEISFLQFMTVGIPFVVMFLPVVWMMLWRIGRTDAPRADVGEAVVDEEIVKLGPVKREEIFVLAIFLAAAALWIAGQPLAGWLGKRITAFKVEQAHVEGGIAIAAALVLLATRMRRSQVLSFRSLKKVPWETLLLLGGSFAMASAIKESGLSDWMGKQLLVVQGLDPFWQVLLASVATVGLSAVASNTATIAVMLIVLKGAVAPAHLNTTLFTATIASSCDFALPAGTPPNAIVFGSGYVTIPKMARTGVVLDLLAAILAAVWCWVIVRYVL